MQQSVATSAQSQAALAPAGVPAAATIDALVDALGSENRLLGELVTVLRRQRDAVAGDDLQQIDDSVFATHRILVTLGEARRRRKSLNRILGGAENIGVEDMEAALGPRMTDAVRSARDGLKGTAKILSREVEMNRRVLRQALTTGEQMVRAMCAPADKPLYSADTRPATTSAGGGILINRQV
jgi:FlgN protein